MEGLETFEARLSVLFKSFLGGFMKRLQVMANAGENWYKHGLRSLSDSKCLPDIDFEQVDDVCMPCRGNEKA